MNAGYQMIQLERTSRIATIRLNRPDKMNALSKELQHEVVAALDDLAADDGVRAVILTGNGKAFSSGYSLSEGVPSDVDEVRRDVLSSDAFARAVWTFPKPLVAAVHGYCLAGACEIAMLCDLTVSTDTCQFGEPEVRFGAGSTLVLPWLVPMKIAKELLLGGALINAQRAYEIGLINRIVSEEDLIAEAERMAGLMAEIPPAAARFTKRGINNAYEVAGMWSSIAYHSEMCTLMLLADSEETDSFWELASQEGVRAALKWRDARFQRYDAPQTPDATGNDK